MAVVASCAEEPRRRLGSGLGPQSRFAACRIWRHNRTEEFDRLQPADKVSVEVNGALPVRPWLLMPSGGGGRGTVASLCGLWPPLAVCAYAAEVVARAARPIVFTHHRPRVRHLGPKDPSVHRCTRSPGTQVWSKVGMLINERAPRATSHRVRLATHGSAHSVMSQILPAPIRCWWGAAQAEAKRIPPNRPLSESHS